MNIFVKEESVFARLLSGAATYFTPGHFHGSLLTNKIRKRWGVSTMYRCMKSKGNIEHGSRSLLESMVGLVAQTTDS
jgi:hypothetical protein